MILSSAQIRAYDSMLQKADNISQYELVEKAADAVFCAIKDEISQLNQCKVLVICGGGLNGADGLCLAAKLSSVCKITDILPAFPEKLCDTARKFYDECLTLSIKISDKQLNEYDIIIDAVFGIGFCGDIDSKTADLFRQVAAAASFKISIDVPSGVYADSSAAANNAFEADLTVAVTAKKPCHVFYPAMELCGKTVVARLGDDCDINKINPYMYELDRYEYKSIIKKRSDFSHKGSFGRAGLVVGSADYRGAAVLSVKSALRCGVGLAFAYIPECIYGAFESDCISAVIKPLKCAGGGISDKSLASQLDGCSAVLCGCGLGLAKGAKAAVYDVMNKDTPVVADADALSIIAENKSLLCRQAPTVLTPHIGEFARLCGCTIEDVLSKRLTLAMQFSKENKCVLLLKDSTSVAAFPDGRVFILSNPTSALAKGGSGDVLAGMICSFMAQGYDEQSALLAACSLHNECGHLACEKLGAFSVLPEDIIDMIPQLLR